MEINPSMFLPTIQEEQFEINVIKSQIARVLSYLADPKDKASSYPTKPCEIEPISHKLPELHMLKLMDALDNLAEGFGKVFESIMKQAGLSVEEFFGRLQPMDDDLGTVKNFNCLQAQRAPSKFPKNRLDNMFFQLGAAHTLWNIGSCMFTHHFGDSADMTNCGAWQHLEALGFRAEKAIQKKDFTLMINQMEQVFEANAYHFLRVILKSDCDDIGTEKELMKSESWNSTIDECYKTYFSPQACIKSVQGSNTKLQNTLLLVHDFSAVVEAKRSMKAGDVGRLIHSASIIEKVLAAQSFDLPKRSQRPFCGQRILA
ncbi:hypothetical protein PCANC_05777 [Puccinia coronata f. sp. avenae]|uniref:DUF6589 domain-containing protein n=1 Tax=Puccinia coronata f. sp. avenae TaxID=200324 RepID=A0A2N5VSF5_9BASI|nr:hypothetical protein PCANC_05777 [Puccinia coronata f. sp. avenae]